jgi:hypothetical protein
VLPPSLDAAAAHACARLGASSGGRGSLVIRLLAAETATPEGEIGRAAPSFSIPRRCAGAFGL